MGSGFVTGELGELAAARSSFGEAASIFREIGDQWGIATSLTELARIAYRERDPAAQALAGEAVAISRAISDPWQTVQALGLQVEIARFNKDYDRASALGEEAVALAAELGQHSGAAWAHRDLGHLALIRGDPDRAISHFAASHAIFMERGYKLGLACALIGFAALSIGEERATIASRLLGSAQQLIEETSTELAPADSDVADRVAAAARGSLGEPAFAAAFARGRAMPIDEVRTDWQPQGRPLPNPSKSFFPRK
jgi:hypothetical protein